MDVFKEIRTLVSLAIGSLSESGMIEGEIDLAGLTVERPKHASHGEVSTNAAIIVAKSKGWNPLEIAGTLASRVRDDSRVRVATVAGPGFLNLEMEPEFWRASLSEVLRAGRSYGRLTVGRGKSVNLEFVSANPTGPLHIGHARGAVFGDALGRLLEFAGYDVTREYYVNDGGAQVDALARSCYLRYLEALGEAVEFGKDEYKGEYLRPIGEELARKFGSRLKDRPESEWLDGLREFAVDRMLTLIKEDLALIGVTMDRFSSERALYAGNLIENAIEALEKRGLIYQGVLDPPKGTSAENWTPRKQELFRSTRFGDDVDRPIRKADGSWTYFAPDIAYHFDKIVRGYDELINVFGADHGGYTKRIKAAVMALSDGRTPIDVKLTQLVRVSAEGKAQRMSKRAGHFVQLREAVDQVGPDVTRFVMLMRRNDVKLDFDFDEVRNLSRENPVFYVQYAHARICSVIEKAAAEGFPVSDADLESVNWNRIERAEQLAFARRIVEWPRTVESSAQKHEPHRIVFYLNDLTSEFHSLWTQGNSDPELRMVQKEDRTGTLARIALARCAGIVISTGLGILGVKPMKEMRS